MKVKITHLFTVLLCVMQFTVFFSKVEAVTAYPNQTQYKQPDGSTLTLLFIGPLPLMVILS